MSHLKLQKLLYYVEAYHLAAFETSIIEDEFEAWVHGPVSRKIYAGIRPIGLMYDELMYKEDNPNNPITGRIKKSLTDDQYDLIDQVLEGYGGLNAFELENMTHSESPWLETRKGLNAADHCNKIIAKSSIMAYFKELIYGTKKN